MHRSVRILAATLLALAGLQLVAPVTVAAPAEAGQLLQLRASANKVPFGKQFDLTATVQDVPPGSAVNFYASHAGARTSLGTAVTDGQGRASVLVQPSTSASYTAALASNETVESASVPVGVAPLLTVEPHKRIATVWVFSASAKPAVDGIRVQLQRRVGKKWTKVQKAVTKRGVFEFTLSVPAGSSKWRLVSLDSANYAAAVSQVRTVSG